MMVSQLVRTRNVLRSITNLRKLAREMPGQLLEAKSASPLTGMVDSAAESVWRQKHRLEQKKACNQVTSKFSIIFKERSEHGMALLKEPCTTHRSQVGNSGLKAYLDKSAASWLSKVDHDVPRALHPAGFIRRNRDGLL